MSQARTRGVRLDPIQRRALMARFRSHNTRPEVVLRGALREAGVTGYRLHLRDLPGRPDIAFTRWRVAVFVDGTFWHGHPGTFRFGTKGPYWDAKIRKNQARDRLVDGRLAEAGWRVVRLWDTDVTRDPSGAAATVATALAAAGRTGAI
jgi:DNA mismatch endonuclease, patch repair protein